MSQNRTPPPEYGRIQFTFDPETGAATVHIENTQRSGDFWLPIGTPRTRGTPIGYLRLREIKPHSRIFELAEMRPADGPLPPHDRLLTDLTRYAEAAQHGIDSTEGETRIRHEAAHKAYRHAIELVERHHRSSLATAEREQ